jgi:hypothetical protein
LTVHHAVVTWIPRGNKSDDTEKNGFISPDFVKSFISELLTSDRSMSLFDVNVMSKITHKHRLFTLPRRITTNNNKDIVVVDSTSRDTGRVVVVGWEGGLRWTYTGHFKINVTTQFDPYDVVTTTAEHIIVCDSISHALHLVLLPVGV